MRRIVFWQLIRIKVVRMILGMISSSILKSFTGDMWLAAAIHNITKQETAEW